jgi:hypothetical protein
MDIDISENQKRKQMSPVCAILLDVAGQTAKDDERSRDVAAVADGQTIKTASSHGRRKGRGFGSAIW